MELITHEEMLDRLRAALVKQQEKERKAKKNKEEKETK